MKTYQVHVPMLITVEVRADDIEKAIGIAERAAHDHGLSGKFLSFLPGLRILDADRDGRVTIGGVTA